MIKSATAYTYEIDDLKIACQEIKEQIQNKINLLKNSVGILLCDPDFYDSGVVDALYKELGFPIAGVTTSSQAVNAQVGDLMLTLMVLTSDDIEFVTGMTDSLEKNELISSTDKAINKAMEKNKEKPAMAIIFPPLLEKYPGDAYITAFENKLGQVPVFGTLTVDDSITYECSMTICDGTANHDTLSFILFFGNINPRFVIATVSEKKIMPYSGEITSSKNERIMEINNAPASKYFESIGLAQNGVLHKGVQFIPFIMDIKKADNYDGIPVVRALYKFDEDGSALCRGCMYEKSIFTLGSCSKEDVLETSLKQVENIVAMNDVNAIIIFSCIVRRMAFGVNPLEEAKNVRNMLNPDIPFIMGYSGGEICPTSFKDKKATNRFHNYSFIACIL